MNGPQLYAARGSTPQTYPGQKAAAWKTGVSSPRAFSPSQSPSDATFVSPKKSPLLGEGVRNKKPLNAGQQSERLGVSVKGLHKAEKMRKRSQPVEHKTRNTHLQPGGMSSGGGGV